VLLSAARRTLDSTGNLGELLTDALMFGVAMDEAERSAAVYVKSAKPGLNQVNGVLSVFNFYQQLGRPAAAAAAMARVIPDDAPAGATAYALVHYFHGYGDSATALPIVARLIPEVEKSMAQDRPLKPGQVREICVLELWRVMRGDIRNTTRAIGKLRNYDYGSTCVVLLKAMVAAIQNRPDAADAFNRVDSTYLAGGAPEGWIAEVARWRESQGDLPGALRAIQRCVANMGGNFILAYCLREEGRIAARAGERETAIKAYNRYLELRYNPEPSVKPEVDRVRADLARLLEEPRR
jgi:tetratricopeptide (TPR) repeat protein